MRSGSFNNLLVCLYHDKYEYKFSIILSYIIISLVLRLQEILDGIFVSFVLVKLLLFP
jgi:hypothetical protein